MIKLYVFGPGFGAPDVSPFGIKSRMQLAMAGLPCELHHDGYPNAPKGKLPYIDDDGTVVADSTFIRSHIESTRGVDLDAGLDPAQRATAWAIERMLEDNFYWIAVHFRWALDANFEVGPSHYFDDVPEAHRATVRDETRQDVIKGLHAHGLSRHTDAEITEIARRTLDAAETLLADKRYLFGDRPTAVDATLAGMVACASAPVFSGYLLDLIAGYPRLQAHCARMVTEFLDTPMEAAA